MADTSAQNSRPGKKRGQGLRRKKRRLPVRIDMTPMVDIAFLLLIFYMVTTVFSRPQAMELVLPPDGTDLPVGHLLTIRVDENNDYYWNMNRDMVIPVARNSLPEVLKDKVEHIPKLVVRVKIHEKADFDALVEILDNFDIIERAVNLGIAQKLGVTYEDLYDEKHPLAERFNDERYSFRYALAGWETSDNRRIDKYKSTHMKQGGES